MTPMDLHHFFATDVRVISADVHRGSEEAHELMWEISFAEPDDGDDFRFVVGWLHCAGDGIQVTVSVGAIVVNTGVSVETKTDFEKLLQESAALDTIYQRASDAARIIIALTDGTLELPRRAPLATIAPLENPTEDAESEKDTPVIETHGDEQS